LAVKEKTLKPSPEDRLTVDRSARSTVVPLSSESARQAVRNCWFVLVTGLSVGSRWLLVGHPRVRRLRKGPAAVRVLRKKCPRHRGAPSAQAGEVQSAPPHGRADTRRSRAVRGAVKQEELFAGNGGQLKSRRRIRNKKRCRRPLAYRSAVRES